jgi:hypothetical protein
MPIRERKDRPALPAKLPAWLGWLYLPLLIYIVWLIWFATQHKLPYLQNEGLTYFLIALLAMLVLFNPFARSGFLRAGGNWRALLKFLWLFALIGTLVELAHHSGLWGRLAIHDHKLLGNVWVAGITLAALIPFISLPRIGELPPWSWLRKPRKDKEQAVAA